MLEQEIKVSVICNVYNHGKYIRDALEGFVTQQTSFPFEVLVHDDASTDNSADIIREYEARYPDLIKPIYQTENQYSKGGKISRRFQAPRTRGKYVALCEGDDYWTDPLKLQKQYDFMETHPEYTLCTCSTVWLDMQTGRQMSLCRTDRDRDVSIEEMILEEKGRVFQYATFFIRAEHWVTLPDWVASFPVGDYPQAINAALHGKVRMLADTMAVYRNHADGSWTSRVDKDKTYKIRMYTRMVEGLEALDKATDGRYHDVIQRRIRLQKYYLARVKGDLKGMCSGELGELFRSRSLRSRVGDLLQCKLPGVHRVLIRGWKKIKK